MGSTSGIKIGGNAGLHGTDASPFALIAYPNTSVAVSGLGGDSSVIDNWYPSNRKNSYVHLSKLKVTAYGNDPAQCNGVSATPGNRLVGLEITGPTVYGGYGGAITGTNGVPSGGVYLGIYIHNYGYQTAYAYNWDDSTWTSPPYNGVGSACTNCTSVDRFQHLYYISNRSTTKIDAYEIGWNYLTDNPVLHGIHIYDMGDAAGWNGTMKVHHNVIKNQRGDAIDISYPGSTNIEVHDNIIISDSNDRNTGRAFTFQEAGNAKIYNNTVYGYNYVSIIRPTSGDYRNNIMVDTKGVQFINDTPTYQSNNLFYSTGSTAPPSWATSGSGNITGNPLFTNVSGYDFSLTSSSPAKGAGSDTVLSTAPRDFLGQARQSGAVSIGAFEYSTGSTGLTQAPTNLRVF